MWSPRPDRARPLFDHPVVGELSVQWIEPLGRYAMLCDSTDPRGVVLTEAGPLPTEPPEDLGAFARALLDGAHGRVVESVAGPSSNDAELELRWYLGGLAGEPPQVWVVDGLDGPWGFVSSTAFTLRERADGDDP